MPDYVARSRRSGVMIPVLTIDMPLSPSALSDMPENDPVRPQYHFTPPANWMNDPNGMVYYQGEYHLFYQYYPGGYEIDDQFADPLRWGPMHWGHAVSTDLVHWKYLPIALTPDSRTDNGSTVYEMLWSGSAVVDWNNASGFQQGNEPPLVAIFTITDTGKNGNQRQGIAYSNDRGRTWTKYTGNPVLPNPGIPDFRDPKVFWHEATKQWVMIVSARDRIRLYTSPNLKEWSYASEFGDNQGSRGLPWECPELFELKVDGDLSRSKWVMLVSVLHQSPYGGSGTQYFIGDFDGKRFVNDHPADSILWLDYGRDDYAGVTWSDHPQNDSQRLFIGWMSNWDYAQGVPAYTFRSAMTLPRILKLKAVEGSLRLISEPVPQLQTLRADKPLRTAQDTWIDGNSKLLEELSSETFEIIAEFAVNGTTSATEFGFRLRQGDNKKTVVGYAVKPAAMFVDRAHASLFTFRGDDGKRHSAPLAPADGKIKLHIFVDRTSVEVFGNDGREAITDILFPPLDAKGMAIYATDGRVKLDSLEIYPMRSVYEMVSSDTK